MPTHAVIDPENGKPLRFAVTGPDDMPIVTYHVRGADGGLRDATADELTQCGDFAGISDEQDADPAAPIVSRSHHTHSPLHRRFWPLEDHPSYVPVPQAEADGDPEPLAPAVPAEEPSSEPTTEEPSSAC